MSGLVNGLQNRLRRFESARHLQNQKASTDEKVLAFHCLFFHPSFPYLTDNSLKKRGQRIIRPFFSVLSLIK